MKLVKMAIPGLIVTVVTLGAVPVLMTPTPNDQPEKQATAIETGRAYGVFAARVQADPKDAVSATILGDLALQLARETGDPGYLVQAKTAFEAALTVLPDRVPAKLGLARAHLALHEFDVALSLGVEVEGVAPGRGLEVIGDASLAVGDYERAASSYQTLAGSSTSPLIEVRLAQLEFLHGSLESARGRIFQARRAAQAGGASGEPAAWFHTRVGDVEFAAGDYEAAEEAYRSSLEIFPDYHLGWVGLGRTLAALGDMPGAVAAYEKAVSIQPLPGALTALGNLYELTGQSGLAGEVRATAELVAELSMGLYDRELALYLADHSQEAQALEIARANRVKRSDVYTHDTLAWALYRSGQLKEALVEAEAATALGTADALLWYHLGVIRLETGDQQGAVQALRHALELSPRFDPVAAPHARELLGGLIG